MMARCDDPLPHWTSPDEPRENLPTHVIGDAHHRHHCQHDGQRCYMDRDKKDKQRDDHRARQCLDRVERHCRPGGWRAAGVVDGVRDAKPMRHMHPAMRPVKPAIMRKQVEKNRQRPIPERHCGKVFINQRPAPVLPPPGNNASRKPVNRGTGQAPQDLAPDLRVEPDVKPRMPHTRGRSKSAADNQIADADDANHRHGRSEQGKHRYHGRGRIPSDSWREAALPRQCGEPIVSGDGRAAAPRP